MRAACRRLREGASRRTSWTALALTLALAGLPATAQAAPANDDFENATLLEGDDATVVGSNDGATRQTGEWRHPDGAGRTVWYRWVAPWSGRLRTTIASGGFDAKVLPFLDTDPYDDGAHIEDLWPSGVYVRRGETYWLAVDSARDSGSGTFTLTIALTRAPAHDDFLEAKTLTGTHATDRSTNFLATNEGGEPEHAWPRTRESVWYRWTAPANGWATVDLSRSDFDTATAVYTGGDVVYRLTQVAGTDDARLSFQATAGQSYAIAVATETGPAGIVDLSLDLADAPPPDPPPGEPPFEDQPGAPANDDFAEAQGLNGQKLTVRGSNAEASLEDGEPAHPHGTGRSVWYRWTPPRNGIYTVEVTGDGFTAVVEPYTAGSSFADLESSGGFGSGVSGLRVRKGKPYYLAVDGADGEGGDFTLRIGMDPAAENDDYADATVLTGFSPTDLSYIDNATPDSGPPPLYDERTPTVWYRWTAPATGLATLDLSASRFSPMEAVYEEAGEGKWAWVGGAKDPVMRFWAREGETYAIQVASQYEYSGQLKLALDLASRPLPPDYTEPPVFWPVEPAVPERYFPPGDPGSIIPPGPVPQPAQGTQGGVTAEPLELLARASPQKLRSVLSRGFKLTVGCAGAPCSVRVRGADFRAASVNARRPTKVMLKLTPAAKRKLKKGKSLRSAVRVTARGADGRTATLTRKLTIKR